MTDADEPMQTNAGEPTKTNAEGTMKTVDVAHLAVGFLLCFFSAASLALDLHIILSIGVTIFLAVYVVLLLIECAYRSEQASCSTGTRPEKNNKVFDLPHRFWAPLLVVFLVCTNVFAFANIYTQSECIEIDENGRTEVLKKKSDAIYFSAVTLTTLGYGDFTPKESGRVLVVWQLASGFLLLLSTVPLVIARISSW